MPSPLTTRPLDVILRGVSRSIYLTLRVAPRATRRQLAVGYLFCRAADTMADTRLLARAARLESLRRFRAQFEAGEVCPDEVERIAREVGPAQSNPEERRLLASLQQCFDACARFNAGDRDRIHKLVTTLTRGMEMDLERFPAEESGQAAALAGDEDLDLYTYYVAGCVGEFWTDLQIAHLRALSGWDPTAMREKGIIFGKALQMTNILRDVDRDLAIGRCYFPAGRLEAAGVRLVDLHAGRDRGRLRPILTHYLAVTLGYYRSGWDYTLAIPRRLPRLRLACAWPLLIGLKTLARLARSPDPYAPGTLHKVPRAEVYALLRGSACRVLSNRWLERLYRELELEARGALVSQGPGA